MSRVKFPGVKCCESCGRSKCTGQCWPGCHGCLRSMQLGDASCVEHDRPRLRLMQGGLS